VKRNNVIDGLKTHYGIEGNLTAFDSYDDEIYRVDSESGPYILKVYNSDHDLSELQMQMEMMKILSDRLSAYEIPAAILSKEGESIVKIDDRCMTLHPFLTGVLMGKANPILPSTRYSLGVMLGTFQNALDGVRLRGDEYQLTWDNAQVDWIDDRMKDIGSKKDLIKPYYDRYLEAKVEIQQLRKSIIHNDANENNLFVRLNDHMEYVISGAIDFGDSIYTHTINDVAIACSYAMQGVPDPLDAAADIIKGYHEVWPLQEIEIKHLFTLIGVRLINSLAHSTISAQQNPENEYILIHSQPTIELLQQLTEVEVNYVHYYFRAACGWNPVPQTAHISDWLKKQTFHPIYGKSISLKNSTVWDLSVGSTFIGSLDRMENTPRFTRELFGLLEDENKDYGIGRYDEVRLLYTEDSFAHETNNGPAWRTLHLGLDVFTPAGQAVHAPLDGKVILADHNDLPKDYGHVIILEHQTDDATPFYTLYGHLSASSLATTRVGNTIRKGEIFAWLGDYHENGDWVPHIHFQIITDLLGNESNFPGVADPRLRSLWLSICPDPNLILGVQGLDDFAYKIVEAKALMERRKHMLPKNLSVSFKSDPLHIVRGHGVHLYDHHAQGYLDTVNNVAHVGHENSTIVQAGQQQMAILNTNTRYLHSAILDYAQALLDKLPDHLEVVYFCNSGSEANDLAMRLAKAHTQQTTMVVLEQGYHGHTANCIDVSSYKFDSKGGHGQQEHVIKLDMPDTYRGQHQDAISYLRDVDRLLHSQESIAGFIGEAILSCGGQIVPPSGYFKGVYDRIRAKGGICISDEVQTGFGRVGERFWAFELHDINPDIVTMGKPIGNGHPLAALATTRSIAESFDNGMEYFNTYGGNPVSCTIGHAVLNYIQDYDLQSKAKTIGDYLIKGLKELQQKYSCIGDVRGRGLFLGVEFIDKDTAIPSRTKADYIVKRMKDYKIQMSTDGPDHNVIKIKPPMVFDKTHADRLLSTMKIILTEDFMSI